MNLAEDKNVDGIYTLMLIDYLVRNIEVTVQMPSGRPWAQPDHVIRAPKCHTRHAAQHEAELCPVSAPRRASHGTAASQCRTARR